MFGAVLLVLAMLISRFAKQDWMHRLPKVTTRLALALIVVACPPFSSIAYAIFLGRFVVAQHGEPMAGRAAGRMAYLFNSVLAIALVAFTAIEFVHLRMPTIVGVPNDHLLVIGRFNFLRYRLARTGMSDRHEAIDARAGEEPLKAWGSSSRRAQYDREGYSG